jgi:hypothetical protein
MRITAKLYKFEFLCLTKATRLSIWPSTLIAILLHAEVKQFRIARYFLQNSPLEEETAFLVKEESKMINETNCQYD